MHLIDVLQRWLPAAVPPEKVALKGDWSRPKRLQYKSSSQLGSGSGPYVEVLDAVWRGTVECRVPVAGIAFLEAADRVYWVKSAPAVFSQPVEVRVRGGVDYSPDRATFSCGLGQSWLPGMPLTVSGGSLDGCRIGSGDTTTGVPYQVCQTEAGRFIIVLVQQALARTGRCRLWRLRHRAAVLLPLGLREVFTQRRRGSWESSKFDAGNQAGAG
jgi:hypothetical protein